MTQYIDKSAVIAEIESYISNYKEIVAKCDSNDSTWVDSVSMIYAKIDVLQHLLSFLDTLEVKEPTASDRGMAEEIIINLKRVEQDYRIDLTREMEWVRNKVKK